MSDGFAQVIKQVCITVTEFLPNSLSVEWLNLHRLFFKAAS